MHKDIKITFILIITGISLLASVVYTVNALSISSPIIDNSDRREYVFCPINPTLLNTATTYEINGCPSVRIYVNNWSSLDSTTQNAIDIQLKSAGFNDPDTLGLLNK